MTVGWVLLTADVVALAGAADTSIKNGASDLTASTGDCISKRPGLILLPVR